MEVVSTHGKKFGLAADYKGGEIQAKTSQTLHFLQPFEEKALKYHIFMSELNRNWIYGRKPLKV